MPWTRFSSMFVHCCFVRSISKNLNAASHPHLLGPSAGPFIWPGRSLATYLSKFTNPSSERLRPLFVGRNDEHRVISRQRTHDLWPVRGVERSRDRLRAAHGRFHDQHVLGLADFEDELMRELHDRG